MVATSVGCKPDTSSHGNFTETYRPQYHFSPAKGWMNDPNGLIYYDGEYHLFYQHIPDTIELSGLMHWGHAVSTDLVHWQHLPVALAPDRQGSIWSGNAVVDWNNTSGFQTGDEKVLIAVFTRANKDSQQQELAYSNDRGRTWVMYPDNPVIPNPGFRDFRDPKVFWHEESHHWVMVVAGGDRVLIYTSENLRDWEFSSEFGELEGSHEGVWECPDLIELAIDGDRDNKKWVMLVSVSNGSPNGGSGTQYFIGDFDGTTFTNSYPAAAVHWVDYGRDDYAGVTFSNIPREDGRRIFLGWMNNWWYAQDVPTSPWRGAMTIPRQLILNTSHSGQLQLVSLPILELQALRRNNVEVSELLISDSAKFLVTDDLHAGAFEIIVEFQQRTASEFGLIVRNENNDQTVVGYDVAFQKVFVDRRSSGMIEFNRNFTHGIHSALLVPETEIVKLHVFVDWSSIEVFADNGSVVMTNLVLPRGAYNGLELYTKGGYVRVLRCEVWEMDSIWKE